MKKISFCIPCYNSSKTIEQVITEIEDIVLQRESDFCYEVITAIDGSPDNVYDVLQKISTKNKCVKVIDLAKNFGQANARMAAFSYATGDYVVCLDDDGQCPMDCLWKLIEPLEFEKADVSIAKYPKKKQSTFKNIGSAFNKAMTHFMLDVDKDFEMSNFFVMKKYVVERILNYTNPYPYMSGLLSQTTNKFAFVKMEERERYCGKTGYNFKKLLSLFVNGFTNFSVKPLRMANLLGFICALIGLIYGIIVVIQKLCGMNIQMGYASIITILLFVGGMIMILLGIIGEYVGRIYISLNNAPQYVIKNKINIDE